MDRFLFSCFVADGEVENRLLLPNRFGFSNPLIGISSFLSSPRVQGLATGLTVLDGSPCTSPSGEVGVCTNSRICSSYGGRSSGTCGFLGTNVCCISKIWLIRTIWAKLSFIRLNGSRYGDGMRRPRHAEQHVLDVTHFGVVWFHLLLDYPAGSYFTGAEEESSLPSSVTNHSFHNQSVMWKIKLCFVVQSVWILKPSPSHSPIPKPSAPWTVSALAEPLTRSRSSVAIMADSIVRFWDKLRLLKKFSYWIA